MSEIEKQRSGDAGARSPNVPGGDFQPTDHVSAFEDGGAYASLPVPLWICNDTGIVLHKNKAADPVLDRMTGNQLANLIAEATPGLPRKEMISLEPERPGDAGVIFEVVTQRDEGGKALFVARDATLDHRLREALVDSRQRFKDLVEMSTDFAFETDKDGRFTFVSAETFLGYSADELVGAVASTLLAKPELERIDPFCPPEAIQGRTVWCRRRTGDLAYLRVAASPMVTTAGTVMGARGVARDETANQANEMHLSRAREQQRVIAHILRTIREEADPEDMLNAATRTLARALSANAVRLYRRAPSAVGDMVFRSVSSVGDIAEAVDHAARHLLGYEDEPVSHINDDPRSLVVPATYRKRLNGGLAVWRDRTAEPFDESDIVLLQAVASQLGIALQQMGNQEQLKKMSETDGLTGLLNRRTFIDRLSTRLATEEGCGVLAYVDLDNFKTVNDMVGHAEGDAVLTTLADALSALCTKQDIAARLGGDEFVLWLEGVPRDKAEGAGETVLNRCEPIRGFTVDPEKPVGVSVGIAPWVPETGDAVDSLMARADYAMYEVKHGSKGAVAVADIDVVIDDQGMG
ncbi:MAG: diguanylate cyclase [Alphaproteobacteria bacterium]|nr:diguanylate cyclase [Alphaproteobacteria bacterium]